MPASTAFVTDSNRPQPLWQPPPTACLTASGAPSETSIRRPPSLTHGPRTHCKPLHQWATIGLLGAGHGPAECTPRQSLGNQLLLLRFRRRQPQALGAGLRLNDGGRQSTGRGTAVNRRGWMAGGWAVTAGGWAVTAGGWAVTAGGWAVTAGGCAVTAGGWAVTAWAVTAGVGGTPGSSHCSARATEPFPQARCGIRPRSASPIPHWSPANRCGAPRGRHPMRVRCSPPTPLPPPGRSAHRDAVDVFEVGEGVHELGPVPDVREDGVVAEVHVLQFREGAELRDLGPVADLVVVEPEILQRHHVPAAGERVGTGHAAGAPANGQDRGVGKGVEGCHQG